MIRIEKNPQSYEQRMVAISPVAYARLKVIKRETGHSLRAIVDLLVAQVVISNGHKRRKS